MTHKQRIEKVLKNIDKSIATAKETTVQLVQGAVINRVFMEGKDKYGKGIGNYSANKLPTHWFKGKELNAGGKADSKKFPNGLSWGTFRQINGLQTSFVDLTFTGKTKFSISKNKDSVFFNNEYGKTVSGYNEATFNTRIYAPSKDEANIFFTELNRELDKLWK